MNRSIFIASDTIGDIASPIQGHTIKSACFLFRLVGQFLGFLLGDKAGGLNAVNQELKLLGVKLPLNDPPAPCPPIVLGFIAILVQKVKIGADSFLLHRDFVVVLKVFDDLLDFLCVGFVGFLQQVVQKIEQFQPLVLRSSLALFAIRHRCPSRIGIFLLLYHIEPKEKRADFSALNL